MEAFPQSRSPKGTGEFQRAPDGVDGASARERCGVRLERRRPKWSSVQAASTPCGYSICGEHGTSEPADWSPAYRIVRSSLRDDADMTAVPVLSLGACTLALTLIGCGGSSGDQNAAIAGGSAEAQAYVAQFTKKDPEACFKKDVALKQPELKGPARDIGPRVPPTRVIVMIDGSGSMAGRMRGRTKLELAREAALGFVDGLPASVQTSLLVFGQQGNNGQTGKTKSCSAIDVLAPMSADRGQMRTALGLVRAVGWTPLAAGLDRAEALLAASATPGEQVIYVVSDGQETCGGDPVAVARRINSGRTRAIVNVIGFNLPSGEAAKLTAVARQAAAVSSTSPTRRSLRDTRHKCGNRSDGRTTKSRPAWSRPTTMWRPASPSPMPRPASQFSPQMRTRRCPST
jgi:hypothetical protein